MSRPAGPGPRPGAPALGREALKLTAYFGERERADGALVADRLFDLYGEAGLRTSVLLRGAVGFGLKHRFRTDSLLTLSEDLPLVSVAVDEPARIEALLDGVVGLRHAGLVTLERARLLDDPAAAPSPGTLAEEAKLTIYLGRQERVRGEPAFMAVCELLRRHGIAGATAFLGVDGTVRGERRRARFFGRNHAVPMMVIAVGDGPRIAAALPELGRLLRQPLLTLERVRVCKRDGELIARPQAPPAGEERGPDACQKLMVYGSEAARQGRHPLHLALVRRLREAGISGATALRGVWGFHGDHAPHGDRALALGRHVPVATIVVDVPARIAAAFAIVDELTAERGLVTCETVPRSFRA